MISVPTAMERSGLVALDGFNYQVPLNPVAAEVLGRYPLPNQPNGIFGANTLNKIFKAPSSMNQFSVRVDHRISGNDSVFARVSQVNNNAQGTDPVAAIEDSSFSAAIFNNPRNYAIGETHIFTPGLINRLLFSVNRRSDGSVPPTQMYAQTAFSDGSLANWGPDTFITGDTNTSYASSEKVTWSKGRHLISTGLDYHYFQMDGFGVFQLGPNGQYIFNSGTALAADNFFDERRAHDPGWHGQPKWAHQHDGRVSGYIRKGDPHSGFWPCRRPCKMGTAQLVHGGYFEDDFSITRGLTLNLGVRDEYSSVPYEIGSRLGEIGVTGDLYGRFILNPEPLYKPDRLNLGPRIGFAYGVSSRTVVRGGWAIFTNMIRLFTQSRLL